MQKTLNIFLDILGFLFIQAFFLFPIFYLVYLTFKELG